MLQKLVWLPKILIKPNFNLVQLTSDYQSVEASVKSTNKNFLHFLVHKTENIRLHFMPKANDLLPDPERAAIFNQFHPVQPFHQNHNLDQIILNHFHPFSGIFCFKHPRKVVLTQLWSHLKRNNVFKAFYCMESALLKLTNDFQLTVDSSDCTLLLLLELSAVFDKVHHNILIAHLECVVVCMVWMYSSNATTDCGVPQGTILGQIIVHAPIGKHNLKIAQFFSLICIHSG